MGFNALAFLQIILYMRCCVSEDRVCHIWDCLCNEYNSFLDPTLPNNHLESYSALMVNIERAKNAVNNLIAKMLRERFGNSRYHLRSLSECALDRRNSDCLYEAFKNHCSLDKLPTEFQIESWKLDRPDRMLNVLEHAAPMFSNINSYLQQAKIDESRVEDLDKKLTTEFEEVQKKAIYKIYCNLIVILPSPAEYSENYLEETRSGDIESACKNLGVHTADNRNGMTLQVLFKLLKNLEDHVKKFKSRLISRDPFVRADEDISAARQLEQGIHGKRSPADNLEDDSKNDIINDTINIDDSNFSSRRNKNSSHFLMENYYGGKKISSQDYMLESRYDGEGTF
ncbi:hypothetical protein HELRODRAFT_183939 [Helobdella robusta]|uniref:Uncharacterized protein n=1 Tax=Helobdella robusta TaxID=6412 RepID=T1FKB7_HELRO|nr:hypothetical protein HELRODRAFT_183939 [Helobdella robusta]ESO09721.1 hypothetical protein HELRODRAFT_183939 [Helobdella robusta]